jgi:hypothetical protein
LKGMGFRVSKVLKGMMVRGFQVSERKRVRGSRY